MRTLFPDQRIHVVRRSLNKKRCTAFRRRGAASCIAMVAAVSTVQRAESNEELWDALREGGKVVLMRHAPVDRGPGTGDPLVRDPSCQKEKHLSAQGKQAAALLGRRFKEHGISLAEVRHSPYCRTTATAQIAFGRAQAVPYLSLLEVLGADEAAAQAQALTRVIETFKSEGNLILVTHEPNIRAISFELLKHLDALVIQPHGDEFEELGVLRFSEVE